MMMKKKFKLFIYSLFVLSFSPLGYSDNTPSKNIIKSYLTHALPVSLEIGEFRFKNFEGEQGTGRTSVSGRLKLKHDLYEREYGSNTLINELKVSGFSQEEIRFREFKNLYYKKSVYRKSYSQGYDIPFNAELTYYDTVDGLRFSGHPNYSRLQGYSLDAVQKESGIVVGSNEYNSLIQQILAKKTQHYDELDRIKSNIHSYFELGSALSFQMWITPDGEPEFEWDQINWQEKFVLKLDNAINWEYKKPDTLYFSTMGEAICLESGPFDLDDLSNDASRQKEYYKPGDEIKFKLSGDITWRKDRNSANYYWAVRFSIQTQDRENKWRNIDQYQLWQEKNYFLKYSYVHSFNDYVKFSRIIKRNNDENSEEKLSKLLDHNKKKQDKNNARFDTSESGTVLDKKTGLTWIQCSEGQLGTDCSRGEPLKLNWKDAKKFVSGKEFAGVSDWRLPTHDELYSLLEENLRVNINEEIFPNSLANEYWTDTVLSKEYDFRALALDFEDGKFSILRQNKFHADQGYLRLVRGQSHLQDTRFIKNKNGTVIDTQKELMWKRCIEGYEGELCEEQVKDYNHAYWQIAVELGENSKYAGYDDWRLPTIEELSSIVDNRFAGLRSVLYRSSAINPEYFPNTPTGNMHTTGRGKCIQTGTGSPSTCPYGAKVRLVRHYKQLKSEKSSLKEIADSNIKQETSQSIKDVITDCINNKKINQRLIINLAKQTEKSNFIDSTGMFDGKFLMLGNETLMMGLENGELKQYDSPILIALGDRDYNQTIIQKKAHGFFWHDFLEELAKVDLKITKNSREQISNWSDSTTIKLNKNKCTIFNLVIP